MHRHCAGQLQGTLHGRARLPCTAGLEVDLRLQGQGARFAALDLLRLTGTSHRRIKLAQADLRPRAQQQHVEPRLRRQAIGAELFQQRARFPLIQVGLRLINRDLSARGAQALGIREHALRRRRLAFAQVRLPQQHQRGQHARILLQRILELDDRARIVAALVARQGIFVIAGGLGLAVGQRQRGHAQADKQAGQHGVRHRARPGTQ